MERLYDQMRVRYGNSEKTYREPNSTREGPTPPKKTVSFKEEKKVSRFPRQLSRQMGEVDQPSDTEFTTAVAAATYAINSLEEGSPNRKIPANGLRIPSAKTKNKKEDSFKITELDKLSRWFSGSKRFAEEQEQGTGQNASPIVKTPTLRTGSGKLNLTNSGHTDAKADAWEKAELAKIHGRYEKTYSSIEEWENKKKRKAKHRLDRKEVHPERELQLERKKTLQEYTEEIARIDSITGGARAITDEKKRKDEYKVKEKAKKIRSTGTVPRSCFFF